MHEEGNTPSDFDIIIKILLKINSNNILNPILLAKKYKIPLDDHNHKLTLTKNLGRINSLLSLQIKISLNNNMTVQRTLLSLLPGESAFIDKLDVGISTCKLLNLGVLPKTKVTMVRKAPFGGAYYIKLDGHQLAVRTEEAATIILENQI